MADNMKIRIEVAYALAARQVVVPVELPAGTSMYDAVVQSRIAAQFPPGEIDADRTPMGVFAKVEPNPRARVMADGERIELYRPLVADPNDSRKERAQKAKQKRAGEA